ncbi:MAG: glycosyltransferase [Candidatus Thermoplasmatota archaeon]|nr:glycosyltransferase [Candidatus Thermoplasmatota archaeon]
MEVHYPTVSFIMPVLNEEHTIARCIDALLQLDYPQKNIEIVIATGPSTDNTDKILKNYAKNHPNIKLIPNPTGNTAIGRNLCIECSTGDMLMNYSGHAIAEKNILTVLALTLQKSPKDIVSVGCANISPQTQNFIGKAAGISFSGIMGGKNLFVQNAEHPTECFVDHISFACYRRKPVEEVGMFDPKFWCGQDAELDLRLLKKGYNILFTPKTKVYHFKRTTIRSLFRQMYRYGIARANMTKKHPKTLKIFHLFGTGFILGFVVLLLLTILHLIPLWVLPLLLITYVLASVFSSFQVTKKPSLVLASIACYLVIHVGYGAGFLRGLAYGKL